jgi:hypothetical protein
VPTLLRRFADIRVLLPAALLVAIAVTFFVFDAGDGGGSVEATVSEIVVSDGNLRTVIVDFVTAQGASCHTNVDAGAFGYSPQPAVGSRMLVSYDSGDPCGYVQRQSPSAGQHWALLVAAVIGVSFLIVYWRWPQLLAGWGRWS